MFYHLLPPPPMWKLETPSPCPCMTGRHCQTRSFTILLLHSTVYLLGEFLMVVNRQQMQRPALFYISIGGWKYSQEQTWQDLWVWEGKHWSRFYFWCILKYHYYVPELALSTQPLGNQIFVTWVCLKYRKNIDFENPWKTF